MNGGHTIYPHLEFFQALARRVATHSEVPHEIKDLFEKAAASLQDLDCQAAIESLKLLPSRIHETLRAAATRDVADNRRSKAFVERNVGVSPDVPPGTTRH